MLDTISLRRAARFAALFCALSLGACSLVSRSSISVGAATEPFGVSILDEAFDGELLTLSGVVRAQAPEKLERVLLRVAVSDKGRPVSSRLVIPCMDAFPLVRGRECQGELLAVGQEIPFQLSLHVPSGSDYQLELLWGDDAEAVRPRVVLTDLVVHQEPLGCTVTPCPTGFAVRGVLRNVSRNVVQEVQLGIGYVAQASVTGAVPDSEETLTVPGPFQPDEQRPFRIRLGGDLPAGEIARVRPVVRVMQAG